MDNRKFMDIAEGFASWSKDPNTKVGALAIDEEKSIISQGFNGFPRKFPDDPLVWNTPEKHRYVIHAEANMICSAARRVMKGSEVYVTHLCCSYCAGLIVQSGVKKVISGGKRWNSNPQSIEDAYRVLQECGVEYEVMS